MSSITLLIVLRVLHILAGVFWVGAVVIVARFILPSVEALGPGGAPMMNQLAQVRKLPVRILMAGWVTVLSGLWLYALDGRIGGSAWYSSPAGRVFGLGGALAVVVVLMGTFGNLPTARRMSVVGGQVQASGGSASPELVAELGRLQRRLQRLMNAAAALLMLAAAAMAVARYWPSL